MPAESNLSGGLVVGGWSSRLEEVGCRCVCAQVLQNMPINSWVAAAVS